MSSSFKKIDPQAYNALAEALAVIYWNKKPWVRFLRATLRDAPEILSGLDFYNTTKRETAGEIIDRLMANEVKYQPLTISLMSSIAKMESFPNLQSQEESLDKIATAKSAVAELQGWTKHHTDIAQTHEKYAKEIAQAADNAAKNRTFSENIQKLRSQFMELHKADNPQERGKVFETFVNQLFGLFDLEPRCAYSLEREQIDGAFSFDTDDYILEARWWNQPIGRDHLDVFVSKVKRKGKNALGLYISVNGFTKDALKEYSDSTPFITMEGADLLFILEQRLRLDDLLKRKKRHMNETGDCFFPAKQML